jgi:hypothetical protein
VTKWKIINRQSPNASGQHLPSRDAERLRTDLAIHLSRISPGRDQAVINSCYLQLGELVSAFGLLADKLAEWRSLGRYQL